MLKKIAKWFGILLTLCLLAIGLGYTALRWHDGPVEFWPWFTISIGGPFRSGELTASPASWDFIKQREVIEFQTLTPSTSRTVWVSVVDGRLFIVSGYMSSTLGRLWKQWPVYMEADNRVLLRIDNKLYEQRLQRIEQRPEIVPVMTEISRKYGNGDPGSEAAVSGGFVWMFEVVRR